MNLTPEKIRAGRALKGWSQADLARLCDLTAPTIANIELKKQNPSNDTIKKIIEAFAIGGVSITENGVEHSDNAVTFVKLSEAYRIMEDARSLLKKGEEIVFIGGGATRSPTDFADIEGKMLSEGIKVKTLISDDDCFVHSDPSMYRCIPKKYFKFRDAIGIYQNKVITLTPSEDDSQKNIMIINNKYLAEDYRNIFQFMWDNAKPLKKYVSILNYKLPMNSNYTKSELSEIMAKEAIYL